MNVNSIIQIFKVCLECPELKEKINHQENLNITQCMRGFSKKKIVAFLYKL